MSSSFECSLRDVLQLLPDPTQVVSMSASMSDKTMELAEELMHDPLRISVGHDGATLDGSRQFYVAVDENDEEECKLDTLANLYNTAKFTQGVIFCNTRRKVEWLEEKMRGRGLSVSVMVRVRSHTRLSRRQALR